jgi:glycerol-3-phosphate dehydrogenase
MAGTPDSTFHPSTVVQERRAAAMERLTEAVLDVLVIGGGIVGAGVARDAAMRGLRVGLVEQHDFAFGTSSRTSRLLHGGLRYLAQGRIGLVHEASREKRILHRIAPHLAEPLPFVFPTYRRTAWPLWQLRIGVKIYDLLCAGRNLGPSYSMTPNQVRAHLPGIASVGLTGAVRYFDGLTNDARLVIDTLRSAARHGAVVANYMRLQEANTSANGWICRFVDSTSQRTHEARARIVVNATGPWAPTVPHSHVRLRVTKGVHLVIDRRRLAAPDAVVMVDGKRILFAIPWGERVILGTTDTDFQGSIDQVHTDTDDVSYILRVVNRAFPAAQLIESDVISTWAGVRPLLASNRGGPSDISRAHQINMSEADWFDVAGGKLTTYRLIGEQVVDQVVRRLGRRFLRCRTAEVPLLDAPCPESGIIPPAVSRELVEHYCRNEWAVSPEDIMLRRTSWQHYLTEAEAVAMKVSQWMRDEG